MPELEHELAQLAPAVNAAAGLAQLHQRRKRRRIGKVIGLLGVIGLIGIGALSVRSADEAPTEVAGPDEETAPMADSLAVCDLQRGALFDLDGRPGMELRNETDAPCRQEGISVSGSSAELGSHSIGREPMEGIESVALPATVEANISIYVQVFHQPHPCVDTGDEGGGLVDLGVRHGFEQVYGLPLAAGGRVPLCGAAFAVLREPPEGSVPLAPAGWELLAREEAVVESGTLAAASNDEDLAALWALHEIDVPRPTVVSVSSAIVAITIADDACPPDLTGFAEDPVGVFTPQCVEPLGSCYQPLIPKTFVVVMHRALVGDAFVLRLPATELFHGERLLAVALPGTTPVCEPEIHLTLEQSFGISSGGSVGIALRNTSTISCRLSSASVVGTQDGERTLLPIAPWREIGSMLLPTEVAPDESFTVWVFTQAIRCGDHSNPDYERVEAEIGTRAIEIVPDLRPDPIPWCGASFAVLPGAPYSGGAEPLPSVEITPDWGVRCLTINPPICDDPLFEIREFEFGSPYIEPGFVPKEEGD